MEVLPPAPRHGVGSGSPHAGEASGNDGRGRSKVARGTGASALNADGEHTREDRSEPALADGDRLAKSRFLLHKSSLF